MASGITVKTTASCPTRICGLTHESKVQATHKHNDRIRRCATFNPAWFFLQT